MHKLVSILFLIPLLIISSCQEPKDCCVLMSTNVIIIFENNEGENLISNGTITKDQLKANLVEDGEVIFPSSNDSFLAPYLVFEENGMKGMAMLYLSAKTINNSSTTVLEYTNGWESDTLIANFSVSKNEVALKELKLSSETNYSLLGGPFVIIK